MVKTTGLIYCLFILFTYGVFAQNISVSASTDKTNYLVGDYIYYTIHAEYDKGLKVYPPIIKDSLKNVTLIKNDTVLSRDNNGKIAASYKYILSGYDSTAVTIPSIVVLYQVAGDTAIHSALTNAVNIMVSTLKVNPKEDIKDVKAPLRIPLDWRWIALWILIALIILGAIYYFYRRYQKNKLSKLPVRKVLILPPHTIALNELRELEEKKLWQRGLIKDYHSAITEIIRRYFEIKFGMPALELPTSEAIEMLKQYQGAESILGITYSFLSNADLVKFAKFLPLASINEEMMKQAYEIVNKTIPAVVDKKEEAANVQ